MKSDSVLACIYISRFGFETESFDFLTQFDSPMLSRLWNWLNQMGMSKVLNTPKPLDIQSDLV